MSAARSAAAVPPKITRGDIYGVELPNRDPRGSEIEKTRPCVVVSMTEANALRRTVVCVPLTSSPEAAPPVAIAVPSAGADSVAVCDQIAAIDKRRLKRRVGAQSAADKRTLEASFRLVLVR